MIEDMKLKKASKNFSPKDVIWDFAYNLNDSWKKSNDSGYDVTLSQFKNDEGYYELEIDGKSYQPKTQREVYEILRTVDEQWTEYYEETNSHYYEH